MNRPLAVVELIPADRDKPTLHRIDFERLTLAVERAASDGAGAVVIRSPQPGAFCYGADIADARAQLDHPGDYVRTVARTWRTIETATVPVVVAVNGPAVGAGFELCLAADAVVATDRSWFCFPEAGFGLPALSAADRLAAAIGRVRARTVLLSGDRIDATRARDWGIVTEIATAESLDRAAAALAERLAGAGPQAAGALKARLASSPMREDELSEWFGRVFGESP